LILFYFSLRTVAHDKVLRGVHELVEAADVPRHRYHGLHVALLLAHHRGGYHAKDVLCGGVGRVGQHGAGAVGGGRQGDGADQSVPVPVPVVVL
jgi:hypothetical protein